MMRPDAGVPCRILAWRDVSRLLEMTRLAHRSKGEMHRVLKNDGRLQIGDIIVQKAVPESAKRNIDLWAG